VRYSIANLTGNRPSERDLLDRTDTPLPIARARFTARRAMEAVKWNIRRENTSNVIKFERKKVEYRKRRLNRV
jgi:hypothetical protein